MKRFTLFLFSFILSVVFSTSALAYDVKIDGIYYKLISKVKSAEVTPGEKKYSGEVVIPSSITVEGQEYMVTSIGKDAFRGCTGLTSVIIPNSVTSIEDYAFSGCYGLTSVIIPNSVTSIGNYAFSGCYGLTSVIIPNSVTCIEDYAFSDCYGLTSVTIPNSVTSIGDGAFQSCSGLTSVTIPNSVTCIEDCAFWCCSGLTSVTIPNSVTSIGYRAFSSCSSLTSITIPNSVTSIGDEVFLSCSRLEDIIIVNDMFVYLPVTYSGHYSIPENISQIIGCAFYHCEGLTSVTIPNSVASIGNEAFQGCSGLTSVTIPNSVTSIGNYAFCNCSGLTSVSIPNSVTSIELYTFSGCSGLTSVTIPNSITSIGWDAFSRCSGLTSVTIGNSVTSIGKNAFAKCRQLENVYCYAEKVPLTDDSAFEGSDIEYSTLHVPGSALSSYKTTSPWSRFGTTKALEGTEAEIKKCEKPVISYNNGELSFTCATEGVEYISKINSDDINNFYTQLVQLSGCYNISVTATKIGYKDSDVANAKLYWLTTSGTLDTNINTAKTRGIVIQSAGGFITLSGLDTNERVDFYTVDGAALGSATATDGTATFSATSGTIVVAKIGKESVKIAVE